jgi:hypothetical protein
MVAHLVSTFAGAAFDGPLWDGDGEAGVETCVGVQPVAASPPPSTIARNKRSIFIVPPAVVRLPAQNALLLWTVT